MSESRREFRESGRNDSATGFIGVWSADEKPMPKKSYPRLPARIEDALALQPRIAGNNATPTEVAEYRRIINVLRGKFLNGSLSPENARRLGIV